jgi:hypothetical protein
VALDWGNVPAWFAAVGTVGAFAGTWWVIRGDSKRRAAERLEKEYDEAAKVFVTASADIPLGETEVMTKIHVENRGRRPISELLVVNVMNPRQTSGYIPSIGPDTSGSAYMRFNSSDYDEDGKFIGLFVVEFSDLTGSEWVTDTDHKLIQASVPKRTGRRWLRKRKPGPIDRGVHPPHLERYPWHRP